MPFKCSLCELDIQIGEPMLADEKMNLAHESCAKRNRSIDPPTVVEVVTKVSGPGFGNPTAVIEPCLLPSAPKICSECQQSAISICPSCYAYVHQDFGYAGLNCSGRHEGKCSGARESRTLARTTVVAKIEKIIGVYRNGKHVTPKAKKGRARR